MGPRLLIHGVDRGVHIKLHDRSAIKQNISSTLVRCTCAYRCVLGPLLERVRVGG